MSEALEVNIRQAIGSDSKEIVKSIKQMKTESNWVKIDENVFDLPINELELQIDALSYHPSNLLLVAVLGNEIIGLVTVRELDKQPLKAEFGIVIKKEFWGMGLGHMLIEETLFWAEEVSNLEELFLEVYIENKRAIHLYEDTGFRYVKQLAENQQKMAYKIGESTTET